MAIDRATSTGTIVTSDGNATSFPLPPPLEKGNAIVSLTYVPSSNLLSIETDRGDTIAADLPSILDPAPRGSRPVLYLDQKDWSLLANALYEPGRVHLSNERDAAEQLIALVRDSKIILPMSLGHIGETAKWTNTERRYRLALTITELSRGWQMRHPLDIRGFELRQSLASRIKHDPLPPLDVFTLQPCAAESGSTSSQYFATHDGLPFVISRSVEALNCISSYFDAILDSEAVPMNPTPEWVSANQDFTAWLAGASKSGAQKRKSIRIRFLADLVPELAQATHESGISSEELKTWLDSYFYDEVRTMPSLGLFSEIYQDKHLDRSTVWSSNDLIDMLFLTCAAGYADFVVGEHSLVSRARQAARRLDRPINAYPRVSDLLVALKGDGLCA